MIRNIETDCAILGRVAKRLPMNMGALVTAIVYLSEQLKTQAEAQRAYRRLKKLLAKV